MDVLRPLRTTVADIDDVRANLWNDAVDARSYTAGSVPYQAAILEQYKLYVEMADRISGRRGVANAFFLSLNTAFLAAIVTGWSTIEVPVGVLILPLGLLLAQSAAWFWTVRSYRQLNAAKYVVVGALEERLPASPYWRAEWSALGEGKDRSRYWPMTHLEQWLPLVFGALYVCCFLILVTRA
jgi:hypothetical protein